MVGKVTKRVTSVKTVTYDYITIFGYIQGVSRLVFKFEIAIFPFYEGAN